MVHVGHRAALDQRDLAASRESPAQPATEAERERVVLRVWRVREARPVLTVHVATPVLLACLVLPETRAESATMAPRDHVAPSRILVSMLKMG